MTERFEVDCQGARHTLSFTGGRLSMLDHDAHAEEVLSAMGGSTPFCLRAVDAWAAFVPSPEDPRQLIAIAGSELLSEQGREQIRRATAFTEGRMDRVAAKARAGRGEMWARYRTKHLAAERFAAMLAMPESLRRRWLERYLLEAERAWTETPEGADPPAIELLLMLACEQELSRLGARQGKKLWWKGIAPVTSPALLGSAPWHEGVIMVGVPVSWVRLNWLRADVVHAGRLVLAPGIELDFDEAGAPRLLHA